MNFYRNIDNPGAILTEDEARKQWAEEYDGENPTNLLSFYDQYKRVTGEEAVLADVKHIIATHAPADKFKYMLLDRLRTDCEYFLGNGNRYAPHLWAGAVGTHIKSMLLLYDSSPDEDRPEWLTREQIEEYGRRMNPQKGDYMNNAKPTPRRITLNLTDDEVKGLTVFAIRGGVTVGTLLEDFVADLTYSTRSGGSDEEDRAAAWYDRRGYQYSEGRSFSAHLAEYDDARRFFSDLEDYEDLAKERDYLTAHPDETEPGELESLIDDVVIAREALEEYLNDYRHENPEATLEAIIADAKAHENELTNHAREALESEPTEEEPRSAAATRKAFSSVTVGTLERLEDETYSAYGVNSKPAGLKWVKMALDLAKRITEEPGLLDAITEADLDQLTEENFHTARHATEVAQHLKKYII